MKSLNLKSIFAPIVFYPRRAEAFMANLNSNFCVKVVKKTIGAVGVAGCDFNFTTAADYAEQVKDLGELIPAKARILDVFAITDTTFTTCTTLVADIGTTSGGAEIIASATIKAADALLQPAVGASFTWIAITKAAKHVYVNATPDSGTTWAAITAGKMSVYVAYIDLGAQD